MNVQRTVLSFVQMAPLAIVALAVCAADVHAQGAFPAPLPNSGSAAQPASSSPFPPVNGAPAQQRSSSPFPPVNGAPAAAAPSSSPFPPAGGAPVQQSAFPSGGVAPISGGSAGGLAAPPPPGGAGGGAACMAEFAPLREETEKRGKLIKAASDRKASAQEACGLLRNFAQAELKLMKYVTTNQQRCGIPPEIPKQLKDGHANTDKMVNQVCNAAKQQAAGPQQPAGPSLSEALGSVSLPEANTSSKRSGGTTFDTLNGNVLAR